MEIRVQRIRGEEWTKWIEERTHLLKHDNRQELEDLITKYTNLLSDSLASSKVKW